MKKRIMSWSFVFLWSIDGGLPIMPDETRPLSLSEILGFPIISSKLVELETLGLLILHGKTL
jgi:hypothetical protein